MLKVRVIPTLLWKQFGLVKGVGFDSWRRVVVVALLGGLILGSETTRVLAHSKIPVIVTR
mgnify:CR=1 FL=1